MWLQFKTFWLEKYHMWQTVTCTTNKQGYHVTNNAESHPQESSVVHTKLMDVTANFVQASAADRAVFPLNSTDSNKLMFSCNNNLPWQPMPTHYPHFHHHHLWLCQCLHSTYPQLPKCHFHQLFCSCNNKHGMNVCIKPSVHVVTVVEDAILDVITAPCQNWILVTHHATSYATPLCLVIPAIYNAIYLPDP